MTTKKTNNQIGNAVFTGKVPQQLSVEELIEFAKLKKLLFTGNPFESFSKEQENSPEFKRYDELLTKKLAHLDFFDKVKTAKICN